MRHAHAIELGEDVERQIVLEIQALQRREPVAALIRARRLLASQRGEEVGRKQLPLLLEPEESAGVEIALRLRERAVAEEVLPLPSLGDRGGDGREQPPRPGGHEAEQALTALDQVLVVSAEQLVAPVARE